MESGVNLTVEQRILKVLHHLGIERAHFAASMPRDWAGLLTSHPDIVLSLILVAPWGFKLGALRLHASRLLVISGDQGRPAEEARRALQNLPAATWISLRDYFSPNWADIIADRTDTIGSAMMDFLARMEEHQERNTATRKEVSGEYADISYSVRGVGSPLVLLPLALAPSQWQPLIPALSERYCTITLGGPMLGAAAFLEARGSGYLRVVRSLVDETHIRPRETLLEVGCGSGVILRWLADYTQRKNRVVGVDINPYLLGEAARLAGKAGLNAILELSEGNAESLPFSDNCFDVTIACTVMEEGNADRMLTECVRVTKPGGRVAILVRSIDTPGIVNLPLPAELKRKVQSQSGNVQIGGCADASLYGRMHRAGLEKLIMFPQLATFSDGERLEYAEERALANLAPEEMSEWRQARTAADGQGTFFIAQPFHCAVGRKP